jgi:hypothetical protein
LRGIAMQHKKSQQRLKTIRVDRSELLLPETEAQLSEQLNANRRHL